MEDRGNIADAGVFVIEAQLPPLVSAKGEYGPLIGFKSVVLGDLRGVPALTDALSAEALDGSADLGRTGESNVFRKDGVQGVRILSSFAVDREPPPAVTDPFFIRLSSSL